jgi:hypothetical protein
MKVKVGQVYRNNLNNTVVIIDIRVQTISRKNIEIAQKLESDKIEISPIDLSVDDYKLVGDYNFCTQEIEPLKGD